MPHLFHRSARDPLPAAEDTFDGHFGFSAAVSATPDRDEASDADDPACGAASLDSACAQLMARAAELLHVDDQLSVASVFADLPAGLARGNSYLSTDPHYLTYLRGDGARLLSRLAAALADPRLPVEDRREQLIEVADALKACLGGFVHTLTEAVRRLDAGRGGAVAAALRARDGLRDEAIDRFVRRTVGRDPMQPHPLRTHHAHFANALIQRLGLPLRESRPTDIFMDARLWNGGVAREMSAILSEAASPARTALRMAETGLVDMRRCLREHGIDADRLKLTDPWEVEAFHEAHRQLEGGIGPVSRQVLLEAFPDPASAGDELWRLTPDAGRVAAGVLMHLAALGALTQAPAPPVPVAAWLSDDGGLIELMDLAGAFCWMRENGDDHAARRVSMADLRVLDGLQGRAGRAIAPTIALAAGQREAIARAALADATDADWTWLPPRWLVSDDLASRWWRRMPREAMAAWWRRHPPCCWPVECRASLGAAADQAGDWPRLREIAAQCATAAVALKFWRAIDGGAALAGALREGDDLRLSCWLQLLRRAAPAMGGRGCVNMLTGKDERGHPALIDAMRAGSAAALNVWLDAVDRFCRGGPLTVGQYQRLVLGQLNGEQYSPAGEALEAGRHDLLSVYLGALGKGCGDGLIPAHWMGEVFRSAGQGGSVHGQGLGRAMDRGYAEAATVWLQALLEALRQRLIGRSHWAALMRGGDMGPPAYVRAMAGGHVQAQRAFLDALRQAVAERLIPRGQALSLLLADGDAHGPGEAVRGGHQAVLEAHLEVERELVPVRLLERAGLLMRRWIHAGFHLAIGPAMACGNVVAMRQLIEAVERLPMALPEGVMLRVFAGVPGQVPPVRAAVMAGHLGAVREWLRGVTEASRAGRLSRAALRRLLRAEVGGPGETALHEAVRHSAAATRALASGLVSLARDRLGSRDLMSLMGYRRGGAVESPLALALTGSSMRDRPLAATVDALTEVWHLACASGWLEPRHLERLLSMRLRDGRQGLALVADRLGATSRRAVAEYVHAVLRAVHANYVAPGTAADWLSRGLPEGPGAPPVADWVEQGLTAAEQAGQLSSVEAFVLRGARAAAAAP